MLHSDWLIRWLHETPHVEYLIQSKNVARLPAYSSLNLQAIEWLIFLQSLLNSNSISFIDKALLSIYTTKNSITRRLISSKRIVDLQKIWEIELEIATNEKIDNEILRLICTHHISVLYETVIILSLEKNKVNNFGELLTCFNQNISKTKLAFAIHSPSLKVKTRLSFFFLVLNKKLGWKIFEILLKKIKKSYFAKIKTLKQSINTRKKIIKLKQTYSPTNKKH